MKSGFEALAPVIEGEFVVLDAASAAREAGAARPVVRASALPATVRSETGARGDAAFWCSGLIAVAGAFLFSGGYALFWPGSEQALLRGTLSLEAATLRVEQNGAVRISARAVNGGEAAAALPPLALAVKSGESSLLYPLPAIAGRVPAGGRMSFETQLAAPPEGIAAARLVLAN
ncbi:MAG: hypothetical protein INR68_16005 [Methylobacterium mesophilicum]|nr:hypothetical protein [Methylobacterium mesophilicum]